MCGIIGTNFLSNSFNTSVNLLSHRGPDNQGYIKYQENQFGHTRLSIIDLDDEANQPMEFDGIIITFNGEIYNYKELIKEEDLFCKTKSDTEVLIRLYQKYETKFLDKLNGMFSFCIYDKTKDRFFCARDRFGKKPFFYYYKNGKFIYASEIKSILNLLNTLPQLNTEALFQYLTFWTPIENNSFYEDIYKLPAGNILLLENEQLTISKFYDIDTITTKYYNEKTILSDIEELLIDSMKQRLVGDVDVASLLSGGLDSSFISSLYSSISDKKISTFSIGYDEHLHYSELFYAKTTAEYIKSDHHEITINKELFIETIEDMLIHLDEPLGDSAAIPTFLLSQEISNQGFKVALSGEGSDEIFLGYDKYVNEMKNKNTYLTVNAAFQEKEKEKLLDKYESFSYEYLNKYSSKIKQISYLDLKIWVSDVLMTKLDRMSMANSLELRAPFLDYRLVEYLMGVDSNIKLGTTNKTLLKQIATKYLPNEIIYRQKKGFSSPFIEWLYSVYKDDIYNTINDVNKKLGIFNMDFVKFLYNQGKEKQFKQHIWNLYIFARWFKKVYL